ncbi:MULTISPECIES: DNA translocase FtsK [Methylomonas]|uniref:DNA translocase FtsK n=2 Tax=Methylomonas TaxID=416 RepID=A0A140E4K8_9GAMM|nr:MULTISPECIES: DNA translocase FtsK [Methylomonas]AMK75332.1 cell division protein FtsK [Methylomonas denitrificans]OAH99277.1 cell division protein FtsK [Methylomonas methanica]TCV84921.1 DNA translocase FtsK [Methylomonas methanica]
MVAVVEERAARGYREIALLGFSSCALFFLIALVTFNSNDPGWSHSTSYQSISNACGLFGAWLADFVLSFLGLMAYLIPVMIFWYGYILFQGSRQTGGQWALASRSAGFLATTVSGSAILFLHLHFLRTKVDLPESPGGILGREIGDALVHLLGNSGSTLLLLAIFMTGVTLFTGLSWLTMMAFIGKCAMTACSVVGRQAVEVPERYRADRPARPESTKEAKKPRNQQPEVKTEERAKKSQIQVLETAQPSTAAAVRPLRRKDSKPVDDMEPGAYINALPTLSLLDKREIKVKRYSKLELEEISRQVEDVLQDYGIAAEVEAVLPGPVITRFELRLAAGVKVSRISSLAKDLARGLSVTSVRIVEIIEGKSVIGLEIPNQEREMVSLRDLLVSDEFERAKSKLSIAMGKDISGTPVVADLGKMPHALVAGTTGSGKSVAINTMILSLLYKSKPEDVRMIMIDPKMLELSVYEGIPHLLTPVVTDMKDAQNALRWAVAEMERRYKLMSKVGVRNLAGYNQAVREAEATGQPIRDPLFRPETPVALEDYPLLDTLPSIVIVIDELADMMMVVGKKVEELIARLAQKARAAGIHLVLATQRPSVDVLTGLIKANVPTRISFQVSSRIDSRTIIDQGGAEALLGNGDMLFLPSGTSIPLRAHGAFVDDHEVHRVVEFLKKTGPTNYLDEITQERTDSGEVAGLDSEDSESDALYDEAVAFVTESRKASISSVQRRFKIGYNRAARIIEDMENAGVVSMPETNGSREVLAPPPR